MCLLISKLLLSHDQKVMAFFVKWVRFCVRWKQISNQEKLDSTIITCYYGRNNRKYKNLNMESEYIFWLYMDVIGYSSVEDYILLVKVLEMLWFMGYFWFGCMVNWDCSRDDIVRMLTVRVLLYFVVDSGRFGRVGYGDWDLSVEWLDLYGLQGIVGCGGWWDGGYLIVRCWMEN